MAAYAALVSLMNLLDKIQLHHARHLISLDRVQIETLRGNVNSLIDFLEACSEEGSKLEAKQLASSITIAAYAARLIIELDVTGNISELYVGDQILVGSTRDGERSSILERAIGEIDLVKVSVEMIEKKSKIKDAVELDLKDFELKSSMRSASMVGFDEYLDRILERLIGEKPSTRQVIPITGMGGIGKTTLAKNVYDHPIVVEHFDIRAWVMISQEYSFKKVLLEILYCIEKDLKGQTFDEFISEKSQMGEDQLGVELHKSLYNRRYLITMDDMWSIDIWNQTNNYFPDNSNGSGVIVTTRQSNLANDFGSRRIEMNFLDEDKSWDLLCKKVFDKEKCPLELEEIGKEIANKCEGLPLSLVVIGGLLANSMKTLEFWENVAGDVNVVVNSQDDSLEILSLSYNHLPVYLKPCFLYMGVLGVTRVSELTKSWVAEGFIKPVRNKSLEEVANKYLNDLIDRNLVMARELGSSGKIRTCNMHDLLRDFSFRKAKTEKFISGARACLLFTQEINSGRCVISPKTLDEIYWNRLLGTFGLPLPSQYLALFSKSIPPSTFGYMTDILGNDFFELQNEEKYCIRLICSRYLEFTVGWGSDFIFPSSLHLLWNLQTLVIDNGDTLIAPNEFWELKELRHVKFSSVVLPDPPSGSDQFNVMENLQTLSCIQNFKCSEEVLRRIPNIQKLQIRYDGFLDEAHPYLSNHGCLVKLRSLSCNFFPPSMSSTNKSINGHDLLQKLTFSSSLKKLIMHGSYLLWEDMTIIGSLPHLEVLKLEYDSFIGPEWNPVEGEFRSLKFLLIEYVDNLLYWRADSTHFPCLMHLVLRATSLKEIPMDIGEIPTLRSIKLYLGKSSLVISAMNILEEQLSNGIEDLQVEIWVTSKTQHELKLSSSKNFIVHPW